MITTVDEAADLIARHGGVVNRPAALLMRAPSEQQLKQVRDNLVLTVDRAIELIRTHHAEAEARDIADEIRRGVRDENGKL